MIREVLPEEQRDNLYTICHLAKDVFIYHTPSNAEDFNLLKTNLNIKSIQPQENALIISCQLLYTCSQDRSQRYREDKL